MAFSFVKFEGRNKRVEDRITVTKSAGIGFPTQFYKDNGIAENKYAVLYWDAQNRAIGIKFTNEEGDKASFVILKSKKGYGGNIAAKSFFKAYDIDTKRVYGRYDWEKTEIPEIGLIYTISLKERSE